MLPLTHFLRGQLPVRPNGWKPPPSRNPYGFDPARLTLGEWERLANRDGREHDPGAYDWSAARMAGDRADYPHPLGRVTLAGLALDLRYSTTPLQYGRRAQEGDPPGLSPLLSDAEAAAKGLPLVGYDFAVFDGPRRVAEALDEWGCWLVVVAREYRGIGLGEVLWRVAVEHEPFRPSGGFTAHGQGAFRRTHRALVRDALAEGRYSRLVRAGEIDPARARAIIESAGLPRALPPRTETVLARNDPSGWQLYANPGGAFVLYDPTARALTNDDTEREGHFFARALKGAAASRDLDGPRGRYALLLLFGGETLSVRQRLLHLVLSDCAGAPLYLDDEDVEAAHPRFAEALGPPDRRTGYLRTPFALRGPPLDVEAEALPERVWRRREDPYGEFEARLLEGAVSKFGPEG